MYHVHIVDSEGNWVVLKTALAEHARKAVRMLALYFDVFVTDAEDGGILASGGPDAIIVISSALERDAQEEECDEIPF